MTYVEGFVAAVPTANRRLYLEHAREAAPVFQAFGATRLVETWGDDVPRGEHTDFYRSVQARDDETVVFSWVEYPDRATRDAANRRLMSDPRMQQMPEMPFDGMRMIFAGFAPFVDVGTARGHYVDGYLLPVPEASREAYHAMAAKAAGLFQEFGALRIVEAWGDDVPPGKVTDYRRAVRAEDGEAVVFSWIEWPSKAVRDTAWAALMDDPRMKPEGDMPFDGRRMMWGGFERILDAPADR